MSRIAIAVEGVFPAGVIIEARGRTADTDAPRPPGNINSAAGGTSQLHRVAMDVRPIAIEAVPEMSIETGMVRGTPIETGTVRGTPTETGTIHGTLIETGAARGMSIEAGTARGTPIGAVVRETRLPAATGGEIPRGRVLIVRAAGVTGTVGIAARDPTAATATTKSIAAAIAADTSIAAGIMAIIAAAGGIHGRGGR